MRITSLQAIRILLEGGHIAEICPNTGKTRKYKVHKPHNTQGFPDYITPKQFEEMCETGVIESTCGSTTDKYGNICNRYILRRSF